MIYPAYSRSFVSNARLPPVFLSEDRAAAGISGRRHAAMSTYYRRYLRTKAVLDKSVRDGRRIRSLNSSTFSNTFLRNGRRPEKLASAGRAEAASSSACKLQALATPRPTDAAFSGRRPFRTKVFEKVDKFRLRNRRPSRTLLSRTAFARRYLR